MSGQGAAPRSGIQGGGKIITGTATILPLRALPRECVDWSAVHQSSHVVASHRTEGER